MGFLLAREAHTFGPSRSYHGMIKIGLYYREAGWVKVTKYYTSRTVWEIILHASDKLNRNWLQQYTRRGVLEDGAKTEPLLFEPYSQASLIHIQPHAHLILFTCIELFNLQMS
jgi:hypothetical protein